MDAVAEHGSQRLAAEALGVNQRSLERSLQAAKRTFAMQNARAQSSQLDPIPDPYRLKGVSSYYNKEGELAGQWVKSELNRDKVAEALKIMTEEMQEDVRGLSVPVDLGSVELDQDLLAFYPMGDPHLGMYAWGEETGDDFDVDIAQRDIERAMARLVAQAPRAKTAIIANLGDFFHADDSSNRTARSGHALDVDTRHARVMRMGARLMIRMVKMALTKHEHVIVRNAIGNHDDHSSVALSLIMEAYFEDDPRVHVSTSPAQVWYHRHGKVLIGVHHGHSIPKGRLMGAMATDQAVNWGQTEHRYWYLGHVHHSEVIEQAGVTLEYFRTLAAPDAYAAGAGYRSGRDMRCIVHHREFGETERFTMNINRVRSTTS
jgi:hypothetical protein